MNNNVVSGGRFQDEMFRPRYQRNNKRGGLKNLRCFPTCAEVHKERGFCGRPVVVEIKHSPQYKLAYEREKAQLSALSSTNESLLLCWAEFKKVSDLDDGEWIFVLGGHVDICVGWTRGCLCWVDTWDDVSLCSCFC